jgi:Protein of unknown function (DUF2946)
MVLQLVLSFGHIHLEGLSSGGIAGVAATKVSSSHQNLPVAPAGDVDDYCPVCATIHLASSSFLPDAPVLPVPLAFRATEHSAFFTFVSISLQRAPFQSRAPPLA